MRSFPKSLLLAVGAAALLCGACRRNTGPSEEYEKAYRIHEKLYAAKLDEAYGDPQMDEAIALLKKVDRRSVDVESADKLLAAIELGRKDYAKIRAEDDKRRAQLKAQAASAPRIDPSAAVASAFAPPPGQASEPSAPPASEQTADAGTAAPADPFAVGAPIAALNADGCLQAGDKFQELGTNKAGQTYKLAPSAVCQAKMPGLQNQALLVIDGKIYRRVGSTELTIKRIEPPAPTAPPAPPAPPTVTWPGQPQPGAQAPQPAAEAAASPPPPASTY
jgi:hypothetical protein